MTADLPVIRKIIYDYNKMKRYFHNDHMRAMPRHTIILLVLNANRAAPHFTLCSRHCFFFSTKCVWSMQGHWLTFPFYYLIKPFRQRILSQNWLIGSFVAATTYEMAAKGMKITAVSARPPWWHSRYEDTNPAASVPHVRPGMEEYCE